MYQLYNQTKKASVDELNYDISVVNAFLKDSSEIEQNLLKVEDVMSELIELNKIRHWGENNSISALRSEEKTNKLFLQRLILMVTSLLQIRLVLKKDELLLV